MGDHNLIEITPIDSEKRKWICPDCQFTCETERAQPEPTPEQKQRHFVIRLALIKHEAGQLQMWETMQCLDTAVNRAGWELARKTDNV